jgi:hypothetical protein
LHINPSGKFIVGGPQGDDGLTGRKIMIDHKEMSVLLAGGDPRWSMHQNTSGKFIVGRPQGDDGLTGRKIPIDTYGGHGAHGGADMKTVRQQKFEALCAELQSRIADHASNADISPQKLLGDDFAIEALRIVDSHAHLPEQAGDVKLVSLPQTGGSLTRPPFGIAVDRMKIVPVKFKKKSVCLKEAGDEVTNRGAAQTPPSTGWFAIRLQEQGGVEIRDLYVAFSMVGSPVFLLFDELAPFVCNFSEAGPERPIHILISCVRQGETCRRRNML